MQAQILLCDYAESLAGKLYIQGGGWNQVVFAAGMDVSVAVTLAVPWNATNQKHDFRLRLVTEDSEQVAGPDGTEVMIGGEFEAGRPPGVKPGTDLLTTYAFRFQGLPLPTGRYAFVVEVNGSEIARQTFDAENQEVQTP